MIREDDIARAQKSTLTREQVAAEAKAEERQRWRKAFNHPRADELKTMITAALANSDMTVEAIHALLEKVPQTEAERSAPATALEEATRGMEMAARLTGRDPQPIDPSLLPFAGPQVEIDPDEYGRGAAEARRLLAMCGMAKPATPAEIIGSGAHGLGELYNRFPADQERAGREAAERIKAMMQRGGA